MANLAKEVEMQRFLTATLLSSALLFAAACDNGPTRPSSTTAGNAGGGTCTHTVSQTTLPNIPAAGGTESFTVSSSGNCPALGPTSDVSWINVAASGNSVKITVVGNPNPTVRSGRVVIDSTVSVTVLQDALVPANCTYAAIFIPKAAPDPTPKAGGNGAFSVGTQAGCPWGAASTVPWITLTNATSGVGSFSGATYQVASNTTGQDRTGTIRVQNQELKLTQLGK